MKASEARLIAENKHRTAFRESFDKVMQTITHTAKGGKFEVWYFENLSPEVQVALEVLGYSIKRRVDNGNMEDIIITW